MGALGGGVVEEGIFPPEPALCLTSTPSRLCSPSPAAPPPSLTAQVAARLGCGALAGTTGQTVAYPFDVARRRLQVSGWQGARELHSDHGSVVAYRGMVDCFVRTVREEGFGALFKVRGAACVCLGCVLVLLARCVCACMLLLLARCRVC